MPRTAQPPPDEAPAGTAMPVGSRRAPEPLDPPMVPFALAGLAAWALATLVVLPWRHSHPSWFWICVAGFLWGFPGLAVMLRHDANRRRRRARRAD